MTKVLEGTWEEVAARADELAGRQVKLIVVDEAPLTANGASGRGKRKETLAEAFARVGTVSGLPPDGSERVKENWGEYVEEKHRKGKL